MVTSGHRRCTVTGVTTPLVLTRPKILGFRRRAGGLDERVPLTPESLRRAAWAGLQDSMPRAAVLSLNARLTGVESSSWEHPSLIQLWGPRFSTYVVSARDLAVFSLGRLPDDAKGRRRAETLAARLHEHLAGARMGYGEAGDSLGVNPNALRYAAATGRVAIRWDGARQPVVWTVPPPSKTPLEARLELARRHLHVFGPSTPASFEAWAGISRQAAVAAFAALEPELTAVGTPIGEGWILTEDEQAFRAGDQTAPAAARLLPSGDAHYLLQGADRELLVPEPDRRGMLWTPRVWPGAVVIGGEIAGTWRRAGHLLTIEPWDRLSRGARQAVEQEAANLPLPGLDRPISVRWGACPPTTAVPTRV